MYIAMLINILENFILVEKYKFYLLFHFMKRLFISLTLFNRDYDQDAA